MEVVRDRESELYDYVPDDEREDWLIFIASAQSPGICDLPIATEACRKHISLRLDEDRMLARADCLLRMVQLAEVGNAVVDVDLVGNCED